MYSLQTHIKHTLNIHTFEKLIFLNSKSINLKTTSFNFNKLKLNFTLKNNSSNKIMFLTHLIILEKIIGQKLKFVKSTEHNQNFNIRKGTKIGCTATLRSINLTNFIFLFFTYSLRKLNFFYSFNFSKLNLTKLKNKTYSHLYFSLKKILFFLTISTHVDWDNFSYIYDEIAYGVDFQFQTNYINPFVNRILLSQYGLTIL